MRKLIEYLLVLTAACACLASWGCATQAAPPQTVSEWMDLEPVTP